MGQRATVVITECDHDSVDLERELVTSAGLGFRIEQAHTAEQLVERCDDADGILVQYAGITAEVMDALPRLRAIGRYGVGVDSVDVAAATERGILVTNVPDYGTEAVSDHAIAMALALGRGLLRMDRQARTGVVDLSAVRPLHVVRDRVFGVIGTGRIGQATARKAKGLGYRVLGYDVDEVVTSHHDFDEIVSLENLLSRAQVVSLHVPLTESSRHLIGAAELASMRDDAVIVNTARGGIVDTQALVAALVDGSIAGAGVDCHETEPLPSDHPLTSMDNVILSPHFAWYSEETYAALKERTAQGVIDVLEGREPRNPVNPDALLRPRVVPSE